MKRGMLNILTGVLVLLCVAVGVLWVRTCCSTDKATVNSERFGYWVFSSDTGGLAFSQLTLRVMPGRAGRPGEEAVRRLVRRRGEWRGFELSLEDDYIDHLNQRDILRSRYFRAPHWFVELLSASFPAARLVAAVRRHRRRRMAGFRIEQSSARTEKSTRHLFAHDGPKR